MEHEEGEVITRAQAIEEIFQEFDTVRKAFKATGKKKLSNLERLSYLPFLMDIVATVPHGPKELYLKLVQRTYYDVFEHAMVHSRGKMRTGPNRAAAIRMLMSEFNIGTNIFRNVNRTYIESGDVNISAKAVDEYVGKLREYIEPYVRAMSAEQLEELLTRLTLLRIILKEDSEIAQTHREGIVGLDYSYGGDVWENGPFRPMPWSKKVVD